MSRGRLYFMLLDLYQSDSGLLFGYWVSRLVIIDYHECNERQNIILCVTLIHNKIMEIIMKTLLILVY